MDNQLTILIVDDVGIDRGILKAIFETEYRVVEADDGETALKLLLNEEDKIDIILLDIIMPKMNGIDFLRAIKENKRLREIPVIVNTQAGEQEHELQALELGADDFILKPYNPKVVKRRVKNIVEKLIYQKEDMRKKLDITSDRLNTLIDAVPGGIGIFEIKESGKVHTVFYNDGMCRILGYERAELDGMKKDVLSFVQKEDRTVLLDHIKGTSTEGDAIRCKIRVLKKNAKIAWVEFSAKKLQKYQNHDVFHVVLLDITDEKEAEEQLQSSMFQLKYRAERDPLTGIYNRDTFYRETEKMLKNNPDTEYIMGQWNVERFKVINELFGSKAGDRVLCKVADFLGNYLEAEGTFGRLEADHFVFCASRAFIEEKMSEIEKVLAGEGMLSYLNYPVMSHVGFYIIDDLDLSIDLMCDRANMALQIIKDNYLKRWNYYNESLKETILNEQELITDMETALSEGQFIVYYQPIVDVKTLKTISAEALVRWEHPTKGLISPGMFVPLFERNGFIAKLDLYVCREVCKFLSKRLAENKRIVPVSINLSRINFYNYNLCKEVLALTQEYHVDPSFLKLEITESAYTDNPKDLASAMEIFQKHGFKILMDDFGSGYSSLNMLKDVPVDILKIDMKFMDNLESSERAANILFSIIQMAKSIHMDVVAEGVETESQFELLASMECDSIQGYFFSEPLCEKEFELRLQGADADSIYKRKSQPRQTILVVDDLEISRECITENIKERYNIIEATDGVEGLEILKREFANINLVISDIYMPNMNGLELLQQINNNVFLRKIPVLVVTAYGEIENETKALELGALDVINKPYDPEILKKRIENLLKISENENISLEINALRESASVRKQVQGLLKNNITGMCRFTLGSTDKLDIKQIVFVNERFDYLHNIVPSLDKHVDSIQEIVQNIVKIDRERLIGKIKFLLKKKIQWWQTYYRIQWEDGTIKKILTNWNINYKEENIIIDISEVEIVSMENPSMDSGLEVFAERVSKNVPVNIWQYDIDNDSFDYTKQFPNGRFSRHVLENGRETITKLPAFLECDRQRVDSVFQRLYDGEPFVEEEFLMKLPQHRKKNISYRWIKVVYERVAIESEEHRIVIGISYDVTAEHLEKERRWREALYRKIFTQNATLFAEVDLTANLVLSKNQDKLYDAQPSLQTSSFDDFADEQIHQYVFKKDESYARDMLDRSKLISCYKEGQFEIKFDFRYQKNAADKLLWYTSSIYLVENPVDGHIYASWQIKNIQEEREKYSQIRELAEHDALTSLYNRSTFEKYVDKLFAEGGQSTAVSAFVMLDVDNFKAVNDNFGHDFGDSVLKAVAKMLLETFRKDDIVCRLGGDEFAVFMTNATSKSSIVKRVEYLCKELYTEFDNQGDSINISCSAGIAFGPESGKEFQTLYMHADDALYVAKNNGKNRVSIYEDKDTRKER